MRKIFKYKLKVEDKQRLSIPMDAEILSIQTQGNDVCLWALVDPGMVEQEVVIFCVGTGHDFWIDKEANYPHHLGTVQQGVLVWHFFTFRSTQR